MWSPTDDKITQFMRKIGKVNEAEERDRLEDDVVRMGDLISFLLKECQRRTNFLPENLRQHFQDICWSLKLHMEFHGIGRDVAAADLLNLRELDEYYDLGLGADYTPEIEQAIDPGSKLLEIVSKRKTKRILRMKSRKSLPGYTAFCLLTENT